MHLPAHTYTYNILVIINRLRHIANITIYSGRRQRGHDRTRTTNAVNSINSGGGGGGRSIGKRSRSAREINNNNVVLILRRRGRSLTKPRGGARTTDTMIQRRRRRRRCGMGIPSTRDDATAEKCAHRTSE